MLTKRITTPSIRSNLKASLRLCGSETKLIAPVEISVKERLFTSIKPTGNINLGTYLGVVKNFVQMQHTKSDALLCITDMHSITVSQDPPSLRENIFRTTASLLACGVDYRNTTLFIQSAVKEHCELYWILGLMSSMSELGNQPTYKEKLRQYHEMELGLFTYPVLKAADILLYKPTHVVVGEDETPHVHFAQALSKSFNGLYGKTLPCFKSIVARNNAGNFKFLMDPLKKISNINEDQSLMIYIDDKPHDIIAKIKSATNDFGNDVQYGHKHRVGINNLINIHASVVGKSSKEIISEVSSLDTEKYKSLVAEVLIEHLEPIRRRFKDLLACRDDLTFKLDAAATKAHFIAAETLTEIKQKLGLGPCISAVRPADISERSMNKRKIMSLLRKDV